MMNIKKWKLNSCITHKMNLHYGVGRTILLFVLVLAVFATFEYGDCVITQGHGIAFWHLLFQGNIKDFYSWCMENTSMPASYDMTLYLVFAIWNFPCFLYEHFTGCNAQDVSFFLLYGKTLILLGYLGTIVLVGRLSKNIEVIFNANNHYSYRTMIVYYALSPLLLLYSVYSGNYDVLSLCLMLAGIDSLVNGKKHRFIVFFALAVSMKYFALIIFIPILLLKEKRVVPLCIDTILTLTISLIEKLIFHNTTVSEQYPTSFAMYFLNNSGSFDGLGIGNMSLLLFLYICLCIYCYLQKCDEDIYYYKKVIYVSVCAWVIFFLTVPYYCYWIVFLIPFLTIMVFSCNKNMFMNVVLECSFSVSLVCVSMMRARHIIGACGPFFIIPDIFVKIFGDGYVYPQFTLGDLLNCYNEVYGYYMFLVAIVVASILGLLVLNYPGERIQRIIPEVTAEPKSLVIAYTLRNIVSVIVFVMPTIYFIYQSIRWSL